ncbi:MAG: hypothetical protein K5669_04895, partial [Lachnospiraceae bacterium]|nr:hypothetical protein [Lachnospiraceae bacterium]
MRLNGERINFRAVISCALSCLLIALSFSGCSLIQNKYSISDKTEESAENSVENIIDAAEENIYDASGENTLDASEDTVNGVSENTLNNGYDEEITGVADTVSEGLNKKINLSLSECICLPQSQWQVDVSFPEWRGFADDTLALNDIMGFDYYSGQGKLYVAADPEVTSFDMYINDSKVDTSAFVGGKCYEVDFSKVSVNG